MPTVSVIRPFKGMVVHPGALQLCLIDIRGSYSISRDSYNSQW